MTLLLRGSQRKLRARCDATMTSTVRWPSMRRFSSPDPFDPHWILPFIVLLWFGGTGLLSLLSGWSSLAFQFRAAGPAQGEKFRFVTGSIGMRFLPVNYHHCLFVTINETGFHLGILFLFRFLSPPLFIPWLQVESVAAKRLLFMRYAAVKIRGHWPTISISGNAGKRILEVHTTVSSPRSL